MAQLTYLGPEGTFTHQAALDLAGDGDELVALANVQLVVQSVESGEADGGIVAFENSLEGAVPGSIDGLLLQTERCLIAGERVLPVSFSLFRSPGDDGPLRGVASHPFALLQCARFIESEGLAIRETASTAGACRDLAESPEPGWGAIGPTVAGELYGLHAERTGIETDSAATRFVLLRATCPEPTGKDRSAFSLRPSHDKPGGLVGLMQEFSLRDINLTAIKSRPTKELLGEYIFYLECEGHIADRLLRDAVQGALRLDSEMRFLGSFPEDPARPPQHRIERPGAQRAYEAMLDKIVP